MTFAAFEGADGRSLIVLVSICNEEGKIPTKEADADLLYQSAYEQVKTLYQSQVQAAIKPKTIIGIQLHAYAGCLSLL